MGTGMGRGWCMIVEKDPGEVITKLSTKESVSHTGQYFCDVRKIF